MTKIQFGHGGHILEGWTNLERHEADITKPLYFKSDSADFILIEHVLEHVTPQHGYKFLEEAFRVLKLRGVIRVIVPDIVKIWHQVWGRSDYLALLKAGLKDWYPAAGLSIPSEITERDAVKSLVFCHGHQALWTDDLLVTVMEVIGYRAKVCRYGESEHEALRGVDSHWKYMGLDNCILESVVVEGEKL